MGPLRNSTPHSSPENESSTLAQIWSLLVAKLTNSGHFWPAQLLLGEFRNSPLMSEPLRLLFNCNCSGRFVIRNFQNLNEFDRIRFFNHSNRY